IEGDPIADISGSDIDEAVAFLATVHELRRAPEAIEQKPAAEACLCGVEIVAQIERRIVRLLRVAEGEPPLAAFLSPVRQLLAETAAWAEAEYRRHSYDFARPLRDDARTLCPADFGFHNVLRRADGRL